MRGMIEAPVGFRAVRCDDRGLNPHSPCSGIQILRGRVAFSGQQARSITIFWLRSLLCRSASAFRPAASAFLSTAFGLNNRRLTASSDSDIAFTAFNACVFCSSLKVSK